MFLNAISDLKKAQLLISQPRSFLDYTAGMQLPNNRTAQYISINTFSDLSNELKNHGYMVLRLGSPPGSNHTHFSLVKVATDWNDFFFIDQSLFEREDRINFEPTVGTKSLLAFKIFPRLTESSLVNLALASGLFSKALNLDEINKQLIPATGQSTFTFDFRPLTNSNQILTHSNGQVEIDSLFIGKRHGKDCLFIVEAKSSNSFDSLAKHKLFYPLLAVSPQVPKNMEIIPVYLRIIRRNEFIEFNFAECEKPRNGDHFGALTELKVSKVKRYSLYGYQ